MELKQQDRELLMKNTLSPDEITALELVVKLGLEKLQSVSDEAQFVSIEPYYFLKLKEAEIAWNKVMRAYTYNTTIGEHVCGCDCGVDCKEGKFEQSER